MKNLFLSVCGLALILLVAGCGTTGGGAGGGSFTIFKPGYRSPSDPISQSSLPANPVRRSESWYSNLDGSYQYSHSQGTQNSVSRTWGPYGPDDRVDQSTYENTYESYTPAPRYIAPLVSVYPHGPQAGHIGRRIQMGPYSPVK